jgi:hypothetical protein
MAALPRAMYPHLDYVYALLAQRIGAKAVAELSAIYDKYKSTLEAYRAAHAAAISSGTVHNVGINALPIPLDPPYLFFIVALADPNIADAILLRGGKGKSDADDDKLKQVCEGDPLRAAYAQVAHTSFPFLWLVAPKVATHGQSYSGLSLGPDCHVKYTFDPTVSQVDPPGRVRLADAYITLVQNFIYTARVENARRPTELLIPVAATGTGPYLETHRDPATQATVKIGCYGLSVSTVSVTSQAIRQLDQFAAIPFTAVTPQTEVPERLMAEGFINGTLLSYTRLLAYTLSTCIPLEIQTLLEARLIRTSCELAQLARGAAGGDGANIGNAAELFNCAPLSHLALAFVTVPDLNAWAVEKAVRHTMVARQREVVKVKTEAGAATTPTVNQALDATGDTALQQQQQHQADVHGAMLDFPPLSPAMTEVYNQAHLIDPARLTGVVNTPNMGHLARHLSLAAQSMRTSRLDQIREIGKLIVSVCCQYARHVRTCGRYNVLSLPTNVTLSVKEFVPIRVCIVGADLSADLYARNGPTTAATETNIKTE